MTTITATDVKHRQPQYEPIRVIKFGLLTYNTMTDVAFAWSLYTSSANAAIKMVLFLLSVLFLLVPFCGSIYVWLKIKGSDLRKDSDFEKWERKNDMPFVFLSVMSGSSFGAFELTHSKLFGLELFDMHLPYEYQLQFLSKRLIWSVCLEDLPQLCIQLVVLIFVENNGMNLNVITAAALVSSLISIIIGVYNACNKSQQLSYHRTQNSSNQSKLAVEVTNAQKRGQNVSA